MSDILDNLAKEVDKITNSKSGISEEITSKAAEDDLKEEDNSPMGKLMSESDVKYPKVSDVIEGKVIEVGSNAIYLDIEPFGTGIVLGREIKDGMGAGKLKVGTVVSATVTDVENEEGYIELSIREASHEKAWEDLESKRDTQEIVKTKVLSANKGGLLVEINGISGFLPVSQLSSKNYPRVEDGDKNKILGMLKKLVAQELDVRILDADRESEKLIVSEKATQKERDREVISGMKVGDVIEGEVSGVVDFGAFIKFFPLNKDPETLTEEDKLEGLVHISELAWQLIEDPRDIVKIGSQVKAKIIGIDDDKISLSIRALETDPWSEIHKKYKIGDVVKGKVHRINHFGAFVYLDNDIHGLAHVSEMSEAHKKKGAFEDIVKVGESYDWKILSIEPRDHRMGLALADKNEKPARPGKEKEKEPARNASAAADAGGEKPEELPKEKPVKEKPARPRKK